MELVPSAGKEEGWEAYLVALPDFLDNPRQTSEELPDLHRLGVSHLDLTVHPVILNEMELKAYILDRPDDDEKYAQFEEALGSAIEQWSPISPERLFSNCIYLYKDICEKSTTVDTDAQIAGSLRRYGTRRIDEGEPEVVYGSHTCDYASDAENFARALGQFPYMPTAFYGLSKDLPEVYAALCERYDELITDANDLDDKLLAETFLQLGGTRLLHPFWDGNGRTFAMHATLASERAGVQVRDYGIANALSYALTDINESFVRAVLRDAGFNSFIRGMDHHNIHFSLLFRRNYMTNLRGALDKVIELGVDEDGDFFPFYNLGTLVFKRILGRSELLENFNIAENLEAIEEASEAYREACEKYETSAFNLQMMGISL